MPDQTPTDYDADAFVGVLAMAVAEYPDWSLSQLWNVIDWEAVRWHGETRDEYQSRMVALRERRGQAGVQS